MFLSSLRPFRVHCAGLSERMLLTWASSGNPCEWALLDAGGQDPLDDFSQRTLIGNGRMIGTGCLPATSSARSLVTCCRLTPRSRADQLQVMPFASDVAVPSAQQSPPVNWPRWCCTPWCWPANETHE